MGFVDGLTDLLASTVVVSPWSGFSSDGEAVATYGAGSTYSARVVSKQTKVQTFEGAEEVATTEVWIASTSTFGPSDRVTLPDGSSPVMLAVETYRDEVGVTHSKVFFG